MSLLDPIPWPSSTDDLFALGQRPGWGTTADVQDAFGHHETIYAVGYRDAAEVLVRRVLDTGFEQDLLVYPIMFLYRQYVELRLKEIAAAGARLEDLTPPAKMMARHDLEPLWKYCCDLGKRIDSGPCTDFDNAERTVRQLSWADPGSYAFRYATDKQGKRSLPADLKHIDLQRVLDVMSGVGNLLDGMLDFIDAQQQAKDEIEREYAPY